MNKITQVDATRYLAAGSMMALIVLGLAWELWLAPVRPGGSLLALKVLPLCLPLAGILKNRMYTYRWMSLLVWLYFIEGATRAWSDKPPGNYLAMLEVFLCLLLFAACAFHVRLRLNNAKALAQAASETDAVAETDTQAKPQDTNANTNTNIDIDNSSSASPTPNPRSDS